LSPLELQIKYSTVLSPLELQIKYSTVLSPLELQIKYSTVLSPLELQIKYSTVSWLLELQIRLGRKVHTVKSNSRNSHCQCTIFSKKNLVIRIFCLSGWLVVPIHPDNRNSPVLKFTGYHFGPTLSLLCTHSYWFIGTMQHSGDP